MCVCMCAVSVLLAVSVCIRLREIETSLVRNKYLQPRIEESGNK